MEPFWIINYKIQKFAILYCTVRILDMWISEILFRSDIIDICTIKSHVQPHSLLFSFFFLLIILSLQQNHDNFIYCNIINIFNIILIYIYYHCILFYYFIIKIVRIYSFFNDYNFFLINIYSFKHINTCFQFYDIW